MNRFSLFTILFLFVLLVSVFDFPFVYGSVTEEVYVNSFDARRLEWNEVGSTPYLHNTDVDYISTAVSSEEGDWHFPVSSGSGIINSVKLRFEGKQSSGFKGAVYVYLYISGVWVDCGSVQFGSTYGWVEKDVSSFLDSWDKINNVEVYLEYEKFEIGSCYVRRLTRKVVYTIPVYYTLSISSGVGGSTVPVAGEYSYLEGSFVNVSAFADSGFEFANWVLDGSNFTDNPITVFMNQNHTLTAYFREIVSEDTDEIEFAYWLLLGGILVFFLVLFFVVKR